MTPDEKNRVLAWKKGDLCTYWLGCIHRVLLVKPAIPTARFGSKQCHMRLKIEVAFSLFGASSKKIVVPAYCVGRLDLVTLGTAYTKYGNFIKEQARFMGADI